MHVCMDHAMVDMLFLKFFHACHACEAVRWYLQTFDRVELAEQKAD